MRRHTRTRWVGPLIITQLELAQKDPSQAFRAAGAVKLLPLAAAGLERLHNLKGTALGMNRDSVVADDLPILIFQDLTEQEIKVIQQDHDLDELDDPDPKEPAPIIETCPWDAEEDDVVVEGDRDPVKKPAPLTNTEGCRFVRDAQPAPTSRVLS